MTIQSHTKRYFLNKIYPSHLTPKQQQAKPFCGVWILLHKFVLNYTKEGITTLALTVVLSILSCGILSGIMWLITFVEGIIYLTKTDEEFINIYQINKKPWF